MCGFATDLMDPISTRQDKERREEDAGAPSGSELETMEGSLGSWHLTGALSTLLSFDAQEFRWDAGSGSICVRGHARKLPPRGSEA